MFQLLANRDRGQRSLCIRTYVHTLRLPLVTKPPLSERHSAESRSRQIFHGAAVEDEVDSDPGPIIEPLQRVADLDFDITPDTNSLRHVVHSSATCLRLTDQGSHEDHGRKRDCRTERRLRGQRLVQKPLAPENDGHIQKAHDLRQNFISPSSSSSSSGTSTARHTAIYEANAHLDLDPDSGHGLIRNPTAEHNNLHVPLIRRSHQSPGQDSMQTLAEEYFPAQESGARCLITRQNLDFDDQANSLSSRIRTFSEKDLTASVRHEMRLCMRRMPQAAVIVTAANTEDPQNPFSGATISSFTTVAFEPSIIVSLNLKLPSATFDAIQVSNLFDVNLLNADDRGAETASLFAKGHAASPFNDVDWQASELSFRRQTKLPRRFPPLLDRSPGQSSPVAFRICCTYIPAKTVRFGNQAVLFGVVTRVRESHGWDMEEHSMCLAYIDGRYGRVAPLVNQKAEDMRDNRICKTVSISNSMPVSPVISRESLLALESHASQCAEYFTKSFLSETNLIGLQPQTMLMARALRGQGSDVLRAIHQLSKTVNQSSRISKTHSLLAIGIQQALIFYVVFCGAGVLQDAFATIPDLPPSIMERQGELIGRSFEVQSSILCIQKRLGGPFMPDLHPLLNLQKLPDRVDLAMPYLRRYAEYVVRDRSFYCPAFTHLRQETIFLLDSFRVRLKLMKLWLRGGSLSLVDQMLDLPSRYVVLVHRWLLYYAKFMILTTHLLAELSRVPDKPFKRSLFRYQRLCRTLWYPLARLDHKVGNSIL